MLSISLLDYGVGNLHSLRKALEGCGAKVTVVSDVKDILDAECIAFPGVGAFDRTMEKILPYREELAEKIRSGTPCIGICIGMQIMFDGSDEGTSPGLGIIGGRVQKLRARQIPQMGWNVVRSDDPFFDGIDNMYFYFTHSYYAEPTDRGSIKGTIEYEGETYPIYFRNNNFIGTQFHPEKSSVSGTKFLEHFIQFAEDRL